MSFTSLSEILKKTLKDINLEETFKVYPLWTHWESLVGKAIAAKAKPAFVKGEVLFVYVNHPVWIQELEMQKHRLINKIKTLSLPFQINDIRFQIEK